MVNRRAIIFAPSDLRPSGYREGLADLAVGISLAQVAVGSLFALEQRRHVPSPAIIAYSRPSHEEPRGFLLRSTYASSANHPKVEDRNSAGARKGAFPG